MRNAKYKLKKIINPKDKMEIKKIKYILLININQKKGIFIIGRKI